MTDQTSAKVVAYTPLPWEDGEHPPRPKDPANYHGFLAGFDGLPRAVPLEWRCEAALWLFGFDLGCRQRYAARR